MILEPIEDPKLGQVSYFQKMFVFRWQEFKDQFWFILGLILPEMDINEKLIVESTRISLYLTSNTET